MVKSKSTETVSHSTPTNKKCRRCLLYGIGALFLTAMLIVMVIYFTARGQAAPTLPKPTEHVVVSKRASMGPFTYNDVSFTSATQRMCTKIGGKYAVFDMEPYCQADRKWRKEGPFPEREPTETSTFLSDGSFGDQCLAVEGYVVGVFCVVDDKVTLHDNDEISKETCAAKGGHYGRCYNLGGWCLIRN